MWPARTIVLGLLAASPGVLAAQEIQLTGPLGDEPSFEPKDWHRLRLDAGGILPFIAVLPSESPEILGGGGLRVALSARIGRAFWFEADMFGEFAANEAHQLLMLGADAQVRIHPQRESLGHGLGVSGGYWTSVDSTFYESSPFIGPLVSPVSVWIGGTHLEVRIACLFADTRVDGENAVRLALIAPQATLTFGGSLDASAPHDGGRSSY